MVVVGWGLRTAEKAAMTAVVLSRSRSIGELWVRLAALLALESAAREESSSSGLVC